MQIKNFLVKKDFLGVCNNTEYTANSLCQSISNSLESFINGGEQFDGIDNACGETHKINL